MCIGTTSATLRLGNRGRETLSNVPCIRKKRNNPMQVPKAQNAQPLNRFSPQNPSPDALQTRWRSMESTFRGEPRSANFADLTERFATQSSRFFHGKHGNSLMNKLLPEW